VVVKDGGAFFLGSFLPGADGRSLPSLIRNPSGAFSHVYESHTNIA